MADRSDIEKKLATAFTIASRCDCWCHNPPTAALAIATDFMAKEIEKRELEAARKVKDWIVAERLHDEGAENYRRWARAYIDDAAIKRILAGGKGDDVEPGAPDAEATDPFRPDEPAVAIERMMIEHDAETAIMKAISDAVRAARVVAFDDAIRIFDRFLSLHGSPTSGASAAAREALVREREASRARGGGA